MQSIRILIVAADSLTRAGLAAVLSGEGECVVVGQVSPTDFATSDPIEVYDPEVILCDAGWESSPALELLNEFDESTPPTVVLLSDPDTAGAFWALGVAGLLPRSTPPASLVAALGSAVQGLQVLAAEYRQIARLPNTELNSADSIDALTPRELEVLALLAEGLGNRQIAARLGISEHTIKFHVNAIMSKLAAQSRTEAVVRATRLGLLAL